MAASETVRLRLQFDYPPPVTPDCTVFWLLVDLNRCRVVTDLISLIRQRFGFSSGALLGLYLDGGLLPPAESARLVRDNDCLRVKLEESRVPDLSVVISNGGNSYLPPAKAKKRASKLEEDEETEQGYRCSKKWRRQENSCSSGKASDAEPKAAPDLQPARRKSKRKNRVICAVAYDDDRETKRKSPRKKKKRDYKKLTANPRPPRAQVVKERSAGGCSPRKGFTGNSVRKAGRKRPSPKGSPVSSSDSGSCHGTTSGGLSKCTSEAKHFSENLSAELPEGPSTKSMSANKLSAKAAFNLTPSKDKAPEDSSSSSDSSSESDDPCVASKRTSECATDTLRTAGLFPRKGCPGAAGPSSQTSGVTGWKPSDSSDSRQPPVPPLSVPVPASLGRGWGRGEDLLSWKGVRGRGMRGKGRGRGHALPCALNKNTEFQKQQQLNEILTNSSTIIQNPVEVCKKDYSLLPLLAAAPQVGEKIAFKLLELTSDYSPNVSEYKEGKLLSHNPETQQVDIEILSSLPALKEPGKFDLVYHNENGTEVVEYAVTQEKRITVFWRELIDPRLILESPSNTSNIGLVRV